MSLFGKIGKALKKLPVVGKPLAAVYGVALAPVGLASDIAEGKRIDKALVGSFKSQVADVKELAPYVQTVVSFVPGVGQGVSAAMAAGLALADGQPIGKAMVAGISGAIPGGPLAKTALNTAVGIAQGKRLDDVALNALPIPDGQKQALQTALNVVHRVAKGDKVEDIVLTEALKKLPPDVGKALHTGMAVGHALKIQKTNHVAMTKVTKVLNGVNSKNPTLRKAALAAVEKTQQKAAKGDKQAAAMLTLAGRHAAAQRVTRRFRVHAKTGMVIKVGPTPSKPAHAAAKPAQAHK